MPEERPTRVAVYIDFDNVVISRYDAMFGRSRWRHDNARDHSPVAGSEKTQEARLSEATVDVGALLDYAASFGTVALAKAYADWSVPANAAYRRQLVDRAVDLIQLFALGGTKNGADIRLSVDVTGDLYQYDDLTHVVIVAGDSDYVALAQRCKQLGRFVVGIGVAGSTARALVAACDDFSDYDDLPGVRPARDARARESRAREEAAAAKEAAKLAAAESAKDTGKDTGGETGKDSGGDTAGEPDDKPAKKTSRTRKKATSAATKAATPEPAEEAPAAAPEPVEPVVEEAPPEPIRSSIRRARKVTRLHVPDDEDDDETEVEEEERADPQAEATALLLRAIRVGLEKSEDEWLNSGGVKSQMQRMDPAFKEKALGYSSFRAFLESRGEEVDTERTGQQLQVRLAP